MQIVFTNPESKHLGQTVSIIDKIEDLTEEQLADIIAYQGSMGNDFYYKPDDIRELSQ